MLFLSFQIFVLILIAGAIGVFCGWLLFAKPSKPTTSEERVDESAGDAGSIGSLTSLGAVPEDRHRRVVAELEDELESARELVLTRESDVVRLKGKLKKAVIELDRRTELLRAERQTVEALREEALRRVDVGTSGDVAAMIDVPPGGVATHSFVGSDSDQEGDTSVDDTELQVQALSAEVATAQAEMLRLAEESELAAFRLHMAESALADARSRATEAEHAVEDFRAELARLRSESAEKISSLELEASNSRLRADAATLELQELEQQLLDIQQANARMLEHTTSTIGAAKSHIQAARVSLTGQTPADIGRHHTEDRPPVTVERTPTVGLESLPGATPEMVSHLRELGVEHLADVASWSNGDIARFQEWMPEAFAELEGWPEQAHQLLMDRHLENVVE